MSTLPVFGAFMRRDWRIAISYRASFILELGSIVFVLALFFYLGRLISDSEFAANAGVGGDYFAYAAIGVALLQIAQRSLGTFTRKLREEQTTGTFEALMAAPMSPALIAVASISYDLLRGALSGLVMIVAAIVIFGLDLDTGPGSVALAMMALVGCLGLFAALGVAVGAVTVVLKRAAALLGLAVAALALLGGVYFPVDVLPEPLQTIAELLPFTWGLDVIRAALLGSDVDWAQLAGLYASVAVLLPAALLGFEAAVRRARRTGTLAEY